MDPEGSMPGGGSFDSEGGGVVTAWAFYLKLLWFYHKLGQTASFISLYITCIASSRFMPGGGKTRHQGGVYIGILGILPNKNVKWKPKLLKTWLNILIYCTKTISVPNLVLLTESAQFGQFFSRYCWTILERSECARIWAIWYGKKVSKAI